MCQRLRYFTVITRGPEGTRRCALPTRWAQVNLHRPETQHSQAPALPVRILNSFRKWHMPKLKIPKFINSTKAPGTLRDRFLTEEKKKNLPLLAHTHHSRAHYIANPPTLSAIYYRAWWQLKWYEIDQNFNPKQNLPKFSLFSSQNTRGKKLILKINKSTKTRKPERKHNKQYPQPILLKL